MMTSTGGRSGILLAGPLPPPVGGATITFQTFAEGWTASKLASAKVFNTAPTSPKYAYGSKLSQLRRGLNIAWTLWKSIPDHKAVLIFASTGSYLRFAGFFAWLRKVRGVPVYLSFFGSDLYDGLMGLSPAKRERVLQALSAVDGTFVETGYVATRLQSLGVGNVTTVPGYRPVNWADLPELLPAGEPPQRLRLVFLSQVRRDKGIFVLLEAMAHLRAAGRSVHCDIYGPVDPQIAGEFEAAVAANPTANYCGVASGDIARLLARYDALVLPTWYYGEGHPGVVIEAMIAGIPVVATRFRAVPELITSGENGLLAEPEDPASLAEVLTRLADDPQEARRLGQAHRERLARHDVTRAVERFHAVLSRHL